MAARKLTYQDLDRFVLTSPVTLEDMAELRAAVLELAPGSSVEVHGHTGRIVVDVRWPSGAHVGRAFVPVTS